jgi:hypothetical protein
MNQYLFDREIDALWSVDDLDAMIDEASRSRSRGGRPPIDPEFLRPDFLNWLRQAGQNLNTAIRHLRSPSTRSEAEPLMNTAIGFLNNAGHQDRTFLNERQESVLRYLGQAHRRLSSNNPNELLQANLRIQDALNAAGRTGNSLLHRLLRQLIRIPPGNLGQARNLLQQAQRQVPTFFADKQIAVPRQMSQVGNRIQRALEQFRGGNPQRSILELEQAIRLIRGIY